MGKVGRNTPCPCGSTKKFKYCCGAEDTTPLFEGVGVLLDSPVEELAKPNCSRCAGRGYTGYKTMRDGVKKVKILVYCSCIKEKYFEKYTEQKLNEATIKKAEEIKDASDSQ